MTNPLEMKIAMFLSLLLLKGNPAPTVDDIGQVANKMAALFDGLKTPIDAEELVTRMAVEIEADLTKQTIFRGL